MTRRKINKSMNDDLMRILNDLQKRGFYGNRLANALVVLFSEDMLTFEEFKELENEIGYNIVISIEPNYGDEEECEDENDEHEECNDGDNSVCLDYGDVTMRIAGQNDKYTDTTKIQNVKENNYDN